MRERLFAGALAALSVMLMPVAVLEISSTPAQMNSLREVQEASSQNPALETDENERMVQSILIHEAEASPQVPSDSQIQLTVNIEGQDQSMALSDYLCGVLMGEMPADFPMEALKAQAVAARTYTLRRLESGGVLSDDPAVCQAYLSPEKGAERYGDQYEATMEKLRQAVSETDGEVMTYDGSLIAATYFSCSGGKTESAQAVWGSSVPYLISVDSPGEEEARSYQSSVTMEISEFLEILGIDDPTVSEITYTDGGGVEQMTIGGKVFRGVELRTMLGLRSTIFTMEIQDQTVTFYVLGYGHRVGLSQYGAKAMAESGKDYREILTWYYSGAELTEV